MEGAMSFKKTALNLAFAAALLAAFTISESALAGVTDLLKSLVNSDTEESGFIGEWLNSDSSAGDISHIVVTAAGSGLYRIHLYGRCQPAVCDWGEQVGRNRSSGPDADDVRSVSADFYTGFALKHLTLRQGPSGTLHFDMVTDFTDRSSRHDYEVSGNLVLSPSSTAVTGSNAAVPGAPLASPILSGEAVAGLQPEDCVPLDPNALYVAPSDNGWKLNDFLHTVLNFGVNRKAAIIAERVLKYYRFDEQCFITRPRAKMIYWRIAGLLPRVSMSGQDCTEVHFAKVQAVSADDVWKVVDGDTVLIDFGDDQAGAKQAASVIRAYRLNRQCFADRPDTTMIYWLTQ
jgi:hypothetical protein